MKHALKTFIILFLMATCSIGCQKEAQIDDSPKAVKNFNTPSIVNAKAYFQKNASKSLIKPNGKVTQNRTGTDQLDIDWDASSAKKYKKVSLYQLQDVDILYTHVPLDTNGHAKLFVASVDDQGELDSKVFCILYTKPNDPNLFSGVVLIYNLEGTLESIQKYEEGAKIELSTNGTTANRSGDPGDGDGPFADGYFNTIGALLDWLGGDWFGLEGYLSDDEVVVTGYNPQFDQVEGSGGSYTEQWYDGNLNIPPLNNNTYGGSSTSGNDNTNNDNNDDQNPDPWWRSDVVLPHGLALTSALRLDIASPESQWLINTATQDQLNALADALNDIGLNQFHHYNQSDIDFVLEIIEILSLPFIHSNNHIDYKAQILRLTNHLKLFGNVEDEIYAEYIESLIPDFNTMTINEVRDIYAQVKATCNNLTIKYAQEILTVVATDLIIPVVTYALFEATAGTAIKLLEKIPLSMVLRSTPRLNAMITKTTELGEAGYANARLIPHSTVAKTEKFFQMLTKDAISTSVTTNPYGTVKVAQMGFGRAIVLRPNSTTVPEAIRVIEYQNFNTALGVDRFSLKFIP